MSEMFELVTWVYDFLVLLLIAIIDFLPFPKNFDFSKISLDKYVGMEEESLTISAAFPFDLSEDEPLLVFKDLGFRLFMTIFLKETFWLLIGIESQPAL